MQAEPDEAVLRAEVPLVDDGGQDLGRQVVDAHFGLTWCQERFAFDAQDVVAHGELDAELATVGRFDDQAGELVDGDAEVFDLLDVEAEPARDAGRREAHDADVLEGGRNRESDGLSGHGRVHSDVHLQAHPSRSARVGRRYATLPLRCMRETG